MISAAATWLLQAVAGSVNHHLLAALWKAGARPVGLSGLDGGLAQAVPLRSELGAVGRIVHADASLLTLLCASGYLPTVACLAGDAEGHIYNVNADQMAVACATAFGAEKLLFCTDVEGVRDSKGVVASHLTPLSAQALIDAGTATGGMQAKLNAAMRALENGIAEVAIVLGASDGILPRLMAGEQAGTRFHAGGTRA